MKLALNYLIRKIKSYIPFLNIEREPYPEFKTDMPPEDVYDNLIPFGYQINYVAFNDRQEVLNIRKLYGKRQIHLRLFEDYEVRLHDEWNYEFYPIEHLDGESLKEVDRPTILQLKEILHGFDIE